MIKCKTPEDINDMRESCDIASQTLSLVKDHIKPGVSTEDLDRLCREFIESKGGYPSPLNYRGYPKSICTSINNVVCHGIPSPKVILKDGDIINVDITVYKNKYHGDLSYTFPVGKLSTKAERLVKVTYECLMKGIGVVRPGVHVGDIGHVIQTYAESNGYSVVREFCGHGIGKSFHEEPMVMHYGKKGAGTILPVGAVFTIEPMINEGAWKTKILEDRWTALTIDGKLSAQFEHTIAITLDGHEVLTSYQWL